MIAQLRGEVVHRSGSDVVLDVGGVGYLVVVPGGVAAAIPPVGRSLVLHTSLQVREDSMTLYGFLDPAGRSLFELLLSASGVGPKLALAALSALGSAELTRAISVGDMTTLVAIPGIGKKSAQRLVLELGEKLGGLATSVDALTDGGATASSPLGEVRDALAGLGYSATEIVGATSGLDPQSPVDASLRQALKRLAGPVAAR